MGRFLHNPNCTTGLILLVLLFCLGIMPYDGWAAEDKRPENSFAAWDQLRAIARESAGQARAAGHTARVMELSGSSPNYLSLSLQQARAHIASFVAYVARDNRAGDDMGQVVSGAGGGKWFRRYAARAKNDAGLELLRQAQEYCVRQLGIDPDRLWTGVLDAAMGRDSDFDWVVEQVCLFHLNKVLHKGKLDWRGLQVIPFASARTAMAQVWRTLEKNGIIRPASLIALLGPINPLRQADLELGDHKIIHLTPQANDKGRHLGKRDLWPLDNKRLKALVMVAPASPGARALDAASLDLMAAYLRKKSPNLMVISLWQGAGRWKYFNSFMARAPKNTIGIYSFGDYLGPSAGKAAYVAMHSGFALDKFYAVKKKKEREANAKRYGLSLEDDADFGTCQRIRTDAARQETQRSGKGFKIDLWLAACKVLTDQAKGEYHGQILTMWRQRRISIARGLGVHQDMIRLAPGANFINLEAIIEKTLDSDFVPYILKTSSWAFAKRLAHRHQTVLLPAAPGQALDWNFWLDMRGLSSPECLRAGRNIALMLEEMQDDWSRTQLPKFIRVLGHWDRALFKLINLKLNNPRLDLVMPWISNLIPLIPVVLAAIWLLVVYRLKGAFLLAGLGLLFVFTDSVTTQILRPWLERARPYAALEGIRYCFGADWHISTAQSIIEAAGAMGLPSAHAANSMGPALFVMRFSPRVGAVLVALTLLVSYSRIYLGLHYPGDVITGMLWGGLCGWVWARLVERGLKKKRDLV